MKGYRRDACIEHEGTRHADIDNLLNHTPSNGKLPNHTPYLGVIWCRGMIR